MLTAERLYKTYGEQEILKGIDLDILPGEVYCLLGANGAGKSTTIRIFLNYTTPSKGKAFINGIDVQKEPYKSKKYVAYIPEIVQLYPLLTAMENLDFFSRLAGFRYEKTKLWQFLTDAGLQPNTIHQKVGTFSKGMRQKVGIAIAIAKKAKALIMDEPTSGLDPRSIEEFSAQINRFAAEGGAVLMATHDIFNAVAIGTRIGIMKQGELVHTVSAMGLNASDLQKLYLETI